MSTSIEMTAEELLAMPRDGKRCELVEGELRVMSPAGNEHGAITVRLTWRLAKYIEQNHLGTVFAAETGFIVGRSPDTVRAPNIAFVSQTRLDATGDVEGYWPGAPDLAVEVTSPSDSFSEVEAKAPCWLAAGATLVWVVDPQQKNVTMYRSRDEIRVLDHDSELDAPELLPGWKVPLADVFST